MVLFFTVRILKWSSFWLSAPSFPSDYWLTLSTNQNSRFGLENCPKHFCWSFSIHSLFEIWTLSIPFMVKFEIQTPFSAALMEVSRTTIKDFRNRPWNPDFGIEIHQYQYRRHTASSKRNSFQFSFRFGKSQYHRDRMVLCLWNNFVDCNAGFRSGSYWYKNLEIMLSRTIK